MKPIAVAVVGTGWCGGIRAETLAAHPLVKTLDVAEVRPERLAEIAGKTHARVATKDYQDLVAKADLQAVYVSATPESTHYPMARDFLAAGKHVFLEKPIALELAEADELIEIAKGKNLKFTIGYSHFSDSWIEMVGAEGVVRVDDSHRDVVVNTVGKGMQLPLSTMPGEFVEHTSAGPMAAETVHFLEAVALDRPVLVTPEHARMVMEVYLAADLSAERNEAVALPLKWPKKIRSVSA